jgi:hypothetical protein
VNTKIFQNSNRWLEKSAGRKISAGAGGRPVNPRWSYSPPVAAVCDRRPTLIDRRYKCHPLSCLADSSFRFDLSGFRFASFAPLRAVSLSEQEAAHVALRAACGRLPGQRPLARVQVSGFVFRIPQSVIISKQHVTAAQQLPPPSQNINF